MLIDETTVRINYKLELWREALESNCFFITKIDIRTVIKL